MNPIAIAIFLVSATALFVVPRKLAVAPFLVGSTYMTFGQGVEIGQISLPVYRMLMLVGVARAVINGERPVGGLNLIDKMMIMWGLWTIFASLFHDPVRAGPIYACGVVFNQMTAYFLIRCWCESQQDIYNTICIVALIMIPVALLMMAENITGKNVFAVFGGVPENVMIREGRLRAQGPFRHPILAGTVGATCVPLFVAISRRNKHAKFLGVSAGLAITLFSASSGPVMSLMFGCVGLVMWKFKQYTVTIRAIAVTAYMALMLVMSRPPYYIISKIDITGGSTGWHRSYLIEQTINHFSEWWLVGTDYTRHWMPNQGIASDPHHTDITNYYIGYAVEAGAVSMMLIIAMICIAFRWVGNLIRREDHDSCQGFMTWCIGSSLFSHVVTGISVAYFDQSMLYFWMCVGIIANLKSIHNRPGPQRHDH